MEKRNKKMNSIDERIEHISSEFMVRKSFKPEEVDVFTTIERMKAFMTEYVVFFVPSMVIGDHTKIKSEIKAVFHRMTESFILSPS
jgi:hypothetical protein